MNNIAYVADDGSLLLNTLEALCKGDFSVRMPSNAPGKAGKIAALLNDIIEKQAQIANEISDVARIVGHEGQLAHRASLPDATGGWSSTIRCVNVLIDELVRPTREMSRVIDAVARGDMSEQITVDARGEVLQLKNTINTMVVQLRSFAAEVTRVAREVGTEGKLGGQASVPGAGGTWKDLTDNVNLMASNLTGQVRNIADVTTAVANGDLSKKITVDVKGEIAELKNTINVMVDQLNSFASEVTRVAREVGTEGKLGGQAHVRGVGGIWKDLTDNVNFMASNLTGQVRNIAAVTTAVARGDLSKKITVDVKGEIRELKDTINVMVDQLSSFASEVTRVAREVGTEGKLGGQARVEGVAGTWRDLTENVNQLAANLTSQVRAIADVATAVTRGDLSRSIRVQARGEVSLLKDSINEMIRNLKETTQKNAEQDWLKGNLARITRLLQGQRDLKAVTSMILSELAPLVSAHHGVFYLADPDGLQNGLRMVASYGYRPRRDLPTTFLPGEGLVGQCAIEKQRIWLTNVPRDYILVSSGLGAAPPANIVVLPILFGQQVKAVLEIASLECFTPTHMSFLDQLMESIGVVLNTIEANSRTESLLTQSQSLAQELQQTNLELAEKARLLSRQNIEVERKNREVEQAKLALEEKATQLALSSKYKSEFLANMSHELRTPLNSLLILSQQLSENLDGNLTPGQIEFARTIHGSGSDLLTLINDILDLSKVESGTVSLEVGEYRFAQLRGYVERTFRHMAQARRLDFRIDLNDNLPHSLMIDMTRLQQILKNLLSNAFKFTETGDVSLSIDAVDHGWSPDHPALASAQRVIAFAVADTGIGIAKEKLRLIFEAFQQADGSTARRYGGTGLGLSISRELARLLNGEIQVTSAVGEGSVFTLYLPWYEPELVPLQGHPDEASEPGKRGTAFGSGKVVARLQSSTPAAQAAALVEPLPITNLQHAEKGEDADEDASDTVLEARKVLIVDDDLRNIFALSSVLERKKMDVVFAENGKEGIAMLESDPEIELVLMDVMMPGMDGHDTTRAIRQIERFRALPIITVTAKAMKGDREKGIAAGSSDYITKPVDVAQLLEMIRRWLPPKHGKE